MINYDLSNSSGYRLSQTLIKKSIRVFGNVAKLTGAKYFSLVFVDGPTMRRWNRLYRGCDKITDVLSFADGEGEFIGPEEGSDLGEILICWPQAQRQAKEYGWPIDQEICRLLVHGLAHLVGYEHEGVGVKEIKKMELLEKRVLNAVEKK